MSHGTESEAEVCNNGERMYRACHPHCSLHSQALPSTLITLLTIPCEWFIRQAPEPILYLKNNDDENQHSLQYTHTYHHSLRNTCLGKSLSNPTIPGHSMQVSLRTSCRTVVKESQSLRHGALVPMSPSPSVAVVAAVLGARLSQMILSLLGAVMVVMMALVVVDAGVL